MTTLKPQRPAGPARPAKSTRPAAGRAPGRSPGTGRHQHLFLRRFSLAAALLAILAAVYVVRFSTVLDASSVRVEGLPAAQQSAVRAQVGVPPGTPLAAVHVSQIGDRIALLPIVDRVEVSRGWPHTIVVRVQPRVAVLTVANSQGQLQVVDKHGYAFGSVSAASRTAPMVTLAGTPSGDRQAALVVATQVLASLTPAHRRAVTKVRVTGAQSVSFTLDGVRVTWGDGTGSALKNTVLTALLKAAKSNGGHDRMNVSTPQAPTTG